FYTYTIFTLFSSHPLYIFSFFFFTATAPTEIYTLSLHDALPIYWLGATSGWKCAATMRSFRPTSLSALAPTPGGTSAGEMIAWSDRKSTRLNSSHVSISYAVFCLKKKKKDYITYVLRQFIHIA